MKPLEPFIWDDLRHKTHHVYSHKGTMLGPFNTLAEAQKVLDQETQEHDKLRAVEALHKQRNVS